MRFDLVVVDVNGSERTITDVSLGYLLMVLEDLSEGQCVRVWCR